MTDDAPTPSDDPADAPAAGPSHDRSTSPDRLAEPVDQESPPRLPFPVVGVGASAGGLEAYTEFLQACAPDAGIAYVLVQHLSPKHQSVMAGLLSKHTAMPVREVGDGMRVEPDHVYVIRPGHTVTIHDGHLHLGEAASQPMHRRPIDDFFKSLAEEQRERAIAVLLSGTGSNGTLGCESVKAVGGICLAQEPETAKCPSMPRSLIDSNLADAILRPGEMFAAIRKYASHAYATGEDRSPAAVAHREGRALAEIVAVLRARTRHDFGSYKKPTLVRRVQRRMSLAQAATMSDYARLLRHDPGEVAALSDDLMIHVTGFFRDPEVWESLAARVVRPMLAERPEGSAIRCWVTACSSGEEAYTLGMLLLEAAGEVGKHFDIKIFATDTAERSLGQARAGIFPGGIEGEIAPERLARFFEKDESLYRVRRELRELVVFAPQNVLQDAPFNRLDLCTCRNLLIYIEAAAQRRILQRLHFGLREGGTLVLGHSETVGGAEELFEPIDKPHRIFRRVGPTRHGEIGIAPPGPREAARAVGAATADDDVVAGDGGGGGGEGRALPRATIARLATHALLEGHTPAAVVVDRDGQVVYFHGRTDRFLRQPSGEPTRELIALAREEVRGGVRALLHRAVAEGVTVHHRDSTIGEGEDRVRVELTAAPLAGEAGRGYFLVSFSTRADVPPRASPGDAGAADEMAQELRRVRDELQSTIEERQTSNEEMKASHAEVASVNEELQSSNAELQTSKEELQSLNEELTSVNAQLQAKMAELERTGNDLGSLLTSTEIAVVFLDRGFRIRRFTPAVKKLMDLIPSDVGRPFADMARRFEDPALADDVRRVLETLVPAEAKVTGGDGRSYDRRVLPYRTADDRIDGVVVTFVDVTEVHRTEQALRLSEARQRTLFDSIDEGFCIIEMIFDDAGRALDFRILEVNPAYERHTGLADAVGRRARELIPGLEGHWFEIYGRVATTGEPARFQEAAAVHGRYYDVYAFPVDEPERRRVAVLFTDITERRRVEDRRAFLLRLSDALRPLADPVAIQAEACRVLGEHLGTDRAYYVEVDEAAGAFTIRRDHLRGNSPSMAGVYRIADFGWSVPVLRSGAPIVLADVARTDLVPPADRAAMTRLQIVAHVAVPVVKAGALVGCVSVTEPVPRQWADAEVELVRETAERTWAAVERARAEAALRASEEKYRTLFDSMDEGYCIIEMIYDAPDQTAVDWRYLQVNRAFEVNNGLRGAQGRTIRELVPGIEPKWMAIYDRVARTGEPLRFEENSAALGRDFSLYAFRIGAEPERRVAVIFSDVTDARRVEADLRASEERQWFRLALADALRPLDGPAAVQTRAMELLAVRLGVMRASYFELEPDGDAFRLAARAERDAVPMPERLRLSDFSPALGDAFRSGRTLAVDDTRVTGEFVPDPAPYAAIGVAAWAAVPLMRDGRLVAWIGVHSATPRAWTDGDLQTLDDVAERTWGALERAHAEAALRQREAELARVQRIGQVGGVDIDVAGGLTSRRSPEYLRLHGLSPDATFETHVDWLARVHPEDRARADATLRDALAGAGTAYESEYRIVRPSDGEVRWIKARCDIERDASGRAVRLVGAHLDVTEHKRMEAAVRAAEERQSFLLNLSDALRPLHDAAELQRTAMALLAARLDVARASYFEVDADGDGITVTARHERDAGTMPDRMRLSAFGPEIAGAFRDGRTLVFRDTETETRLGSRPAAYRPIGVRAWAAVPLVKEGRLTAFVGVQSPTPRDWTDAEVRLLEDVAERTWAAVARARAEAALHASDERQAFLLALDDALRPLVDPAEVQEAACRQLGTHLRVDRVNYAEVDGEEYVIAREFRRPDLAPMAGRHRIDGFRPAEREAFAAGQTVVVADVRAEPGLTAAEAANYEAVDARSYVAVPMIKDGRLVAVLGVIRATPGAWPAEAIARVQATVERTWDAVERARAESALRESQRRLRAVFDALPVGVGLSDTRGALLLANREMARYMPTGLIPSRDEARHARWRAVDAAGRPVARDDFPGARALRGETVAPGLEMRYRRDDGTEVWAQVGAVPIRDDAGAVVGQVAVVTDIDALKRADAQLREADATLRQAEARQAFLLALSDALRPLADPAAIQAEACRILGEHLGASRTLFAEIADGFATIGEGEHLAPGVASLAGRHRLTDFSAKAGGPMEAGGTLVLPDVARHPDFEPRIQETYRRLGIGSMVDAMLVKNGRLVAVLAVHQDRPRAWTPVEVRLVEETAERVWAAVERGRAEAQLRQSRHDYRTLAANLPNGAAFVVGHDLRFRLAEGEALATVGLTPAGLEGRTLAEALPPEMVAIYEPRYRQALAGEPFRVEHEASGRWFVTHGVPLRDAAGRVESALAVAYDITDRKRAEQLVAEGERRFGRVMQRLTDYAIVMLDGEGRITAWNEGATRMLGWTEAEAVGQPGAIIFTPEDRAAGRPEREMEDARLHGSASDRRWHLRKDGERFWANGAMTLLLGEEGGTGGGPRGFVKVLADETHRRVAEEALRAAKDAAELASRAKDDFLATLSHELRTPLTAILIWARLLRAQPFATPQAAEGVTAIERSAEAQKQLIDDLLDSARITSGRLRLDIVPAVDLGALVRQAVHSVRPTAEAKGVELTLRVDADVDPVPADPGRMRQVAWNLLANAVKFTPEGGRIDVAVGRDVDAVVLRVADTGRGIAPEFLSRLFERFRQEEAGATRRSGGLGLGLSIARQLVEMHNGTISAESDGPGRGATFTVRLPVTRAGRARAAAIGPDVDLAADYGSTAGHGPSAAHGDAVVPGEAAPSAADLDAGGPLAFPLAGFRVLLVEDDPHTRRAARQLLEQAGASVDEADAAGAAIARYQAQRPDVLVSDIGLPEEDGVSLLARIRHLDAERPVDAATPAIAVTAFAQARDVERARAAGFAAVVVKPFQSRELIAAIRAAVIE